MLLLPALAGCASPWHGDTPPEQVIERLKQCEQEADERIKAERDLFEQLERLPLRPRDFFDHEDDSFQRQRHHVDRCMERQGFQK